MLSCWDGACAGVRAPCDRRPGGYGASGWGFDPCSGAGQPPARTFSASWAMLCSWGCAGERAWRSSPVATGSPRGSRSAPRRLCGAALRRSWTSGSGPAHSSGPTYRRDGRQTSSPSTPPRGAWVPSAPRPTAPRCASAAGKTSGGVSACRRPLAPHAAVPSGHSSTRWTRGHSRPPRALAERAARISTDCSARSTT